MGFLWRRKSDTLSPKPAEPSMREYLDSLNQSQQRLAASIERLEKSIDRQTEATNRLIEVLPEHLK